MKRAVNSYLTQRRRSPAAFTLIELILSMLILSIALLPLVGVLPNNAIQQIQNDRKERAILTANAAADNLTALFSGPETFNGTLTGSLQLASGWYTFCDPDIDSSCRPSDCPISDPSCVPPKMIWKYWTEDYLTDYEIKRIEILVCIDLNDDDSCQESNEFLTRTNKLVAKRCPDSTGAGCP